MSGESTASLPFITRLWFSFVCSLRVLLDGRFAWRMWSVRDGMPELPEPESEPEPELEPESEPESEPEPAADPDVSPALVLLSLLQRDGRLVDFLEQDITDFDDAEIGAAVRVVHEGCRKVLRGHAKVAPVREEEEESRVEITDGVDNGIVKLTGNVTGKPPYRGVLRHRGWRIDSISLPTPLAGHDAHVIAPAEVEL